MNVDTASLLIRQHLVLWHADLSATGPGQEHEAHADEAVLADAVDTAGHLFDHHQLYLAALADADGHARAHPDCPLLMGRTTVT